MCPGLEAACLPVQNPVILDGFLHRHHRLLSGFHVGEQSVVDDLAPHVDWHDRDR